ncbi:MAG: DMT family transporter [Betaproteobacteria bacterium]|jgi:drug/metabolite transporter (DMT)-like permease
MSTGGIGRPWPSYLALAASMTLVGSYVALSKPLVAALPVFLLAGLRFGIAAVAMLPWTRRTPGEPPLSRREHGQLFLMSFFGNFLFSICMLSGIALTTATAAGVILATLPAAVALLARVVLGERFTPRVAWAVALAVGGIAALQFVRADATETSRAQTLLGNLLLLGAVFCEATYVILSKRLAATRAPLRVSALINLWGLALMAPLALWQAQGFTFAAVTPPLWALLVFYALAASLFAVWLWMSGMQRVPANHAGVFTVALPIAATLVGVGLLGEQFTWLHAAALAAAAAGVVLIATAPQQRRTARPGPVE